MAGLVLLLLLALAGCVGVLLALLLAAARGGTTADAPAVTRAARRHETLVSLGATATSVLVALAVVGSSDVVWTSTYEPLPAAPGVLAYTAPFLASVVFAAVRALGETSWPRPRGAVRSAPLARRTVRDLGGRRLVALLGTVAAGLVAVVVLGLTAAPDGRSVAHPPVLDAAGRVVGTGASGPYPGWPFGVPVAVALLLALGAALVALRVITRRPPLPVLPTAHDDVIRRTSAARVLAGVQAWTGSALGLMLLVAAAALANAEHPAGSAAAAAAGAAFLVVSLGLAGSAVPARRLTPAAAAGDRVRGVAA
ncbi:hypothetical protein [Cellulomonas sp. ES6]|uniref:hypothetical protein n=1 Tax=Cellulomonas sp. ES6 TaxID=3039384 RepID=UPI0024B67A93|nr:hypothetical protein [Cellulomonas sp. ES6]WHP18467.1 hypothetical protein P9841_04750 [Cellulomonas sp. ES6]